MIDIREARADEAEAVLELWRQAGATVSATDTVENLQRVESAGGWVLVAALDGRLVGTGIGTFDGWRGNVYRLAVHPDYRRRGIGRALVAECEARLARRGAKRITVLVEKDHPWAMAFWARVGYQLDGRVVRFVRHLESSTAPERGDVR